MTRTGLQVKYPSMHLFICHPNNGPSITPSCLDVVDETMNVRWEMLFSFSFPPIHLQTQITFQELVGQILCYSYSSAFNYYLCCSTEGIKGCSGMSCLEKGCWMIKTKPLLLLLDRPSRRGHRPANSQSSISVLDFLL